MYIITSFWITSPQWFIQIQLNPIIRCFLIFFLKISVRDISKYSYFLRIFWELSRGRYFWGTSTYRFFGRIKVNWVLSEFIVFFDNLSNLPFFQVFQFIFLEFTIIESSKWNSLLLSYREWLWYHVSVFRR